MSTGTARSTTPPEPLLVFDGDCGFCTTSVERLERMLPRFPHAQPSQWTDIESLGLSRDHVTRYVWLLAGGQRFRGHAAFAAMLRMQPHWAVRFVGQLLVTPPFSWAAALGYALIARFRHRLPGGTAACALPRPA
jgi:predicted DCC family thiol-disulfide oxidoreductase YuxK